MINKQHTMVPKVQSCSQLSLECNCFFLHQHFSTNGTQPWKCSTRIDTIFVCMFEGPLCFGLYLKIKPSKKEVAPLHRTVDITQKRVLFKNTKKTKKNTKGIVGRRTSGEHHPSRLRGVITHEINLPIIQSTNQINKVSQIN